MSKPLMSPLLSELEARWEAIYQRLATGEDVPPALRLRTEGLMEAAVLAGLESAEALQLRMAARYRELLGRELAADWGDDWRDFFAFPQIPGFGRRAPVWPTTRDSP